MADPVTKMKAKIDTQLKGTGVSLEIRKETETISLRAYLPPKPGSDKTQPYRQRIPLINPTTGHGLKATVAALRHAQQLATKLKLQIEERTFQWSDWIEMEVPVERGPSLLELWDQWIQVKSLTVQPTTLKKDYARFRQHLVQMGTRYLDESIEVKDLIVATLSPKTAKRMLTLLAACCEWAMERQLIDRNPFAGASVKISVPSRNRDDIDPFNKELEFRQIRVKAG